MGGRVSVASRSAANPIPNVTTGAPTARRQLKQRTNHRQSPVYPPIRAASALDDGAGCPRPTSLIPVPSLAGALPPLATSRQPSLSPRLADCGYRSKRPSAFGKVIFASYHHQELSNCHDHQVTHAPSPPSLENTIIIFIPLQVPKSPHFQHTFLGHIAIVIAPFFSAALDVAAFAPPISLYYILSLN